MQKCLLVALCLFIGCLTAVSTNPKTDWLKEDPEGSGIPHCRKCTYEYKKLAFEEQQFWKEVIFKDGTPNAETWRHTSKQILGRFKEMSLYPRHFIRKIHLEEFSIISRYELVNVQPLPSNFFVKDEIEKFRNDLTLAEQNLLKYYYVTLNLSQDEANDKLQNLYEDCASVMPWQAYELELLEETEKPMPIQLQNERVSLKIHNHTEL